MDFNRITAAEAAALVQNGQTIGLSGFTPAGAPKCTPAEIAKKAEAEHAAGRPFKISIFTGMDEDCSAEAPVWDIAEQIADSVEIVDYSGWPVGD